MDPSIKLIDVSSSTTNATINQQVIQFLNGRSRAMFEPTQERCMVDLEGKKWFPLPGSRTVLSILIDQWTFFDEKPSTKRLWYGK